MGHYLVSFYYRNVFYYNLPGGMHRPIFARIVTGGYPADNVDFLPLLYLYIVGRTITPKRLDYNLVVNGGKRVLHEEGKMTDCKCPNLVEVDTAYRANEFNLVHISCHML